MKHPDKSDTCAAWVRGRAALLVATVDAKPLDAAVMALGEWRRSPERQELLRQYRAGGWNLDDSTNRMGQRLSVPLFEAARRR